jgi:hypothetical protein
MTARDAFALGGTDRVFLLIQDHSRMLANLDALGDDPTEAWLALEAEIGKVADQIEATIPGSITGALALAHHLRCHLVEWAWGDYAEHVADNLIAGLEGLADRRPRLPCSPARPPDAPGRGGGPLAAGAANAARAVEKRKGRNR